MADIRSARWLAFLAAMLLAARNKPADRRTQVHPKGIQFHGVEGGKPFVLDIRGEACEDTTSGQNFAFHRDL